MELTNNGHYDPDSSSLESENVSSAPRDLSTPSTPSPIRLRARSHLLMNAVDECDNDMITYNLVRIEQLAKALGFDDLSRHVNDLLAKPPSSVSFSELEALHDNILSLGVSTRF